VTRPLSLNDVRVTVGRWLGTYIVPADYPAVQELQQRLDGVVAGRLAETCGSCLEHYLSVADPAVWRIRKLDVDFSLQGGLSPSDDVAQNWGQRMATDIHSVLDQEKQGDSVLRFPNGAAFVAQFVFDLVEGRAWEKWYYEEFADMRILSASQVVRSVLLRRDVLASQVILNLASSGRLEAVLPVLTESDAQTVYELCFEGDSSAHPEDGLEKWTGLVLELWNKFPLRAASHDGNRFRDALRLYGRTVTQFPLAGGDARMKMAIDGLLELRGIFSLIGSASQIDAIIQNLALGDFHNAAGLAHSAGAQNPNAALAFFAERMRGDVDWGAQVVAVILGASYQQSFLTRQTISDGESFLSSFGGIFLLGPSFQALRFAELSDAVAEPLESCERSSAVLRQFTALKCLGSTRLADSADDPALRLFSGCEERTFRQALGEIDARSVNLLKARKILVETLLESEGTSQPCFFADLVSLPNGNVLFLLRELGRDEWFDAVPISAGNQLEATLKASLEQVVEIFGAPCMTLYLSESLAPRMNSTLPLTLAGRIATLDGSNDPICAQLSAQLGLTRDQLMNRINSSEKHLTYFSFANAWPDFSPDAALDCTFSLIAHAVLRNFARRLPGFDSSSHEHLYQNFLAGLTQVRWLDGHLEVRLATSPLSVILRMTGLQQQKYAAAWLKGTEVWLRPPQE
jgi:hypothetical protein